MPSALLLSTVLAAVAAPAPVTAETWSFHLDHVLGTSLDMAVSASTQAEAQFAFAAATGEIARLDKVLSGWREDSELAALNRVETMRTSTDLFAVISACEAWRARTDGAFSGRLGEVNMAWRDGAADPVALCATAQRVEAAEVGLDPLRGRMVTRPEAVAFDVDGLAKGYILDAALAAARRAAPCVNALLLDVGGDMVCWGDRTWRVGVADPAQAADNALALETLGLRGGALAVSGPGMRDRLIEGVAYSHLLDPATGQPAARVQAAVIAPTATEADALATALAVMPLEAGLALAERRPGVEALLIADGHRQTTSNWQAACQAAQPLPAGFEVQVTYELPKIEAANYRKPYVLVWVTDLDKTPIKTLLIQGTKQDYQEDNYVWWRRYGRKQPGAIEAMGKPTRPPGRYTVGWDGTDQDGKRVGQGKYLIHIEAAREHGGHAYQTMEVNLGAAPVAAQAAGKDELGAAQARYAKRK